MTKYCTLADATTEMDTTGTSQTIEDSYVLAAIETVSRRIDGLLQPTKRLSKRPYFAPYIENRAVKYWDNQIDSVSGVLDINQYYLELNTIAAGTVTITSQVTPFVNGFAPYKELQLSTSSGKSWYTVSCGDSDTRAYIKPLTINATWGWHPDWDNAFVATSTLAAGINDSVVSFDVAAGEGALFSPGHFIQIDSEWMELTAVATDTLTVIRGVNGSTNILHAISAPVSVLDISQDIVHITARQAATINARRGAFNDMLFSGGAEVSYPQDLLEELVNTLNVYAMDGVD